jgi:cyanoexosortase A
LVAFHFLLVIHVSLGSPTQVILAFLVWWGAYLCSEDLIGIQKPQPTRVGLFIGSFILAFCILRGNNTVHPDNLITLLAPLEGFALAILYEPFQKLGHFKSSLFILSLLPMQVILYRMLPEQMISHVTASASGLLLKTIGKDVTINGRYVLLPSGGVTVHGPCNGSDMICLLLIVAITFLVSFPLHRLFHRALVIIAAPLVAMACNSVRIAMLTLFAASPSQDSNSMFDFFHEEAGSLIFSGVAVSLIAIFYLGLLHKQFSPHRTKVV